MINAIIMASGYSSRMKQNKLLLEYRGKTLIQQTVDTILKCNFSQVILVVRNNELLQLKTNNSLKVIENKNAYRGISESIKLGLKYADDCDGYMFFTIDQPLLDPIIINKLVHSFDEDQHAIVVPRYRGKRGSPVIFPKRFKQELMDLEGDTGGKIIINRYLEQVRFVEINDEKSLFDVDTQEDYKKLLQWDDSQ
ncbi:molybdenum cofactor cytidylyltransferase [Cellulosilyticum sp. I15G10I2]|uniref:molybdenum cofactor cytidylyltransferase n=1 Tax=Cellulosilyticum sp. I15G10I2 TaxID=1892843 RepID=UPI00085BF686|nr:molybdenum cofactor cytidylyltransferase [Cellulosilyticum sp. I15G10I2]